MLVIGAASAEAESVARALLRQHRFGVRILLNDPRARKARLLQRAGAELFSGDASERQELQKAMQNTYAVFGHTDHWENAEKEWQKARNIADAAKENGVQHLVFHFNAPPTVTQTRIEAYIRALDIPYSFIHSGFFFENFLQEFAPQKDQHGEYYFGFPQGDSKLAGYSVEDLGSIVAAMFNEPEEYNGRTIRPVAEELTPETYAAILSRVLNKPIYYNHVPRNIYAAYDIPLASSWAKFFESERSCKVCRKKEMEETYRIHPNIQQFEDWVGNNRERFMGWFNSLFDAIVI